MKIEAEVHNSLYTFTSADSKCGGGGSSTGCSVSVGELPSIAQDSERSSIGRPERLTSPGCDGCGSSTLPLADNQNNPLFDCEHFQFIDDEEADAAEDQATLGDVALRPSEDQQLGSADPPAEVSAEHHTRDANNMSSESDSTARAKSHAVKRQVSFDDSAISSSDDRPVEKELKSLLKRSNKPRKKPKGRVTFDEAVTLYSDESEDIQLLALTTGPDIICAEFYMFDPPAEYQDVPPFEPPAEYRDSEELPPPAPIDDQTVPNEPDSKDSLCGECCSIEMVISNVTENLTEPEAAPSQENSDVGVSKETENTDSASCEIKNETTDANDVQLDSVKESDKMFERFLEAEREFAVDEELNSVFQELDSDFSSDSRNGALDDNFFRKLITLLSSAEGDVRVEDSDLFSSTKFANSGDDVYHETEDDDSNQTHSRTLSEADSDCSISSQDTIIVRFGEDENESNSINLTNKKPEKTVDTDNQENFTIRSDTVSIQKQESFDEVFNERLDETLTEDKPKPVPRESLMIKNMQMHQAAVKMDKANEESLSRQSSGEQSVNSGASQDLPQDADDSTSSDSRSGEVEEEIRLDDIGYDEEDAEDYDEESFRGMAHHNSKIRRIIKKNALQCTLFRGIEAKRRQQPGVKYPRPKSPLLSQESLVEKLKWLTTIDEHKDNPEGAVNFHSKPPDVILSTGGIPINGSVPHGASSESDIHNQSAMSYAQQQFHPVQRFAMPMNPKGGYYVRHDGYHPSLPRQRMACPGHPSQMGSHNMQYAPTRMVAHPSGPQGQWTDQRNMGSMTVPRNFRDWRVIQRVTVNRNGDGRQSSVPADYVRCCNGGASAYGPSVPPDVSRTSQAPTRSNKDELEQFVEQDSKRIEKLRKRYSLAEDDDDPTFGFARRPSVRGVQSRIQPNPSESMQGPNKLDPYLTREEPGQGPPLVHPRGPDYAIEQMRVWNRDPNWRPDNSAQCPIYGPPAQSSRSQMPMHIHRASVALTEISGNATIPYTHRKPHPADTRYHSYAESMYGSTRTLPTKGWVPPDPRTCHNVSNPAAAHQTLQIQLPTVSSQMLQVPPHPVTSKDERGVPEGASSSPKISSDSLYHSPVPDPIASGGPHKDEGVIYYSLNV
ncbi:uncharacterized protein LOC129980989 [Argiope bruennichi]|uniref:uncharacterized protein LOC129980989 n=1 Tax=Argiope bruennichi TaxID=94029 RepID=UPI002493F3CC|nr:uncharacterized protein LOC129980989 [Argiope bruennichi]XP_055947531.1 uncharacterized protein LOC129980989 [Argiope bruennichi]XP_055947533.1 uncharacterized protein LOC129980989 [Argiope bruennichi]XP_055947534.1 uncharacterized protein LOC129980989 [Argiope bruennichi]XP_055947535.1 uncharacterized protein LOC129980989 [Argiope bruennichi]